MKYINDISGAKRIDGLKDPAYRFTYYNTLGERFDFFSHGIEYKRDGKPQLVRFLDISNVYIDPAVKSPNTEKVISVQSKGKTIKIVVDTGEGAALDIFPVYRLLSRLIVGNSE